MAIVNGNEIFFAPFGIGGAGGAVQGLDNFSKFKCVHLTPGDVFTLKPGMLFFFRGHSDSACAHITNCAYTGYEDITMPDGAVGFCTEPLDENPKQFRMSLTYTTGKLIDAVLSGEIIDGLNWLLYVDRLPQLIAQTEFYLWYIVRNGAQTEAIRKSRVVDVQTLASGQRLFKAKDKSSDVHFYPTSENPDGKGLFIEFSLLFNSTLNNLRNGEFGIVYLMAADGTTICPFYLALQDGVASLWCQTRGGFETCSGSDIEYGPDFDPNRNIYPHLDGDGWHRIGVSVHQVFDYTDHYIMYFSLYLDGERVLGISLRNIGEHSNNTNLNKCLLFTAESYKGEFVYSDSDSERIAQKYYTYNFNPKGLKGDETAYFVTADTSITVGSDFVLKVEPSTSTRGQMKFGDKYLNTTTHFSVVS